MKRTPPVQFETDRPKCRWKVLARCGPSAKPDPWAAVVSVRNEFRGDDEALPASVRPHGDADDLREQVRQADDGQTGVTSDLAERAVVVALAQREPGSTDRLGLGCGRAHRGDRMGDRFRGDARCSASHSRPPSPGLPCELVSKGRQFGAAG